MPDGMSNARPEPKRIQFEFSPEAVERLNELKEISKANSYAELVRTALAVYEWVLTTEASGAEIGIIRDDKLVKIVKLTLQNRFA